MCCGLLHVSLEDTSNLLTYIKVHNGCKATKNSNKLAVACLNLYLKSSSYRKFIPFKSQIFKNPRMKIKVHHSVRCFLYIRLFFFLISLSFEYFYHLLRLTNFLKNSWIQIQITAKFNWTFCKIANKQTNVHTKKQIITSLVEVKRENQNRLKQAQKCFTKQVISVQHILSFLACKHITTSVSSVWKHQCLSSKQQSV